MRHRNDTEAAMTVATDPPQTVQPGEEVDVPDHVAGLTCIDEPCPTHATGGIYAGPDLALVGEPDSATPKASRTRTTKPAEEA